MGNISTHILIPAAYQRGRQSLHATSGKPTENQVLGWIDRCIWDLVMHCIPRRTSVNESTPGRLDLLAKITGRDQALNGAGGYTIASGVATTPPDATAPSQVCAYLTVLIGGYSEPNYTYYRSKEISYKDLANAAVNTIYTPLVANPVYAWGDGKLYYLPTSASISTIDYHFIEMPAVMTNASTWPLCDSLLPLALYYVLSQMYAQLGNSARYNAWWQFYKDMVEHQTGQPYNTIEVWSR